MRLLLILFLLSLFIYSCSPRTTPTPSKPPVSTSASYKIYVVKAGETFVSIAQRNNVTTQQLRSANPGVREPLKAGQKIRIPLDTKEDVAILPDTVRPQVKPEDFRKDKYKIVLLLPFKAQQHEDSFTEIEPATRMILEFYEGALIAFDSLEKLGLKAEVHVIDTDQNDKTISNFLSSKIAHEADLIIGPAYSSKVGLVEEFSRKNNKYLISPVTSSPDITKNNENGFQFTPTVPTQIDLASKYIADNFNAVNTLITYKDFIIETDLKNMYMNSLKTHGVEDVYSIIFKEAGNEELKNKLISGRQNFIIIPSSDEAFVAEVYSDLVTHAEEFDISVMGLPTWESFETIDFGKLQNLQTYFFSTSQVNYENYNTREVRRKFIKRWKTDPSVMGYQGYDVAFIFGKMLMDHGLNFQQQLPKLIYQPTQNGINWQKTDETTGYENKHVSILRYKDYELRKLK
jgi:LysM repeat protein/ABC-type branched-subunit amino acid transport system substrate-binding protein